MPFTLGLISTPRKPSCFTACSSSLTAREESCKGTVPSATKRSGHLDTISARRSFTMRASACPSPGSVQVLQPHLDRGQLGRAIAHLLLVGLARERAGELDVGVVLGGIAVGNLRRHVGVGVMAVKIDGKAFAAFLFCNHRRGLRRGRT